MRFLARLMLWTREVVGGWVPQVDELQAWADDVCDLLQAPDADAELPDAVELHDDVAAAAAKVLFEGGDEAAPAGMSAQLEEQYDLVVDVLTECVAPLNAATASKAEEEVGDALLGDTWQRWAAAELLTVHGIRSHVKQYAPRREHRLCTRLR